MMSCRPAMGSFAIAWPGDSAEHVCRKWHTCSAEAECDLSVELTTRMAHGGHCEQYFRKDGVDRHLDRPSPVIPQPFLHLQNFVERQKRLWSGFNLLSVQRCGVGPDDSAGLRVLHCRRVRLRNIGRARRPTCGSACFPKSNSRCRIPAPFPAVRPGKTGQGMMDGISCRDLRPRSGPCVRWKVVPHAIARISLEIARFR